MPEVHIPLTKGMNEGIDPRVLPNGALVTAQNVRIKRDGRLGSRFGYAFVSGSQGQACSAGDFAPTWCYYIRPRSAAAVPPTFYERRPDGVYNGSAAANRCLSDLGAPRRIVSTRNVKFIPTSCDMATASGWSLAVMADKDTSQATFALAEATGGIRYTAFESISNKPGGGGTLNSVGSGVKCVTIGTTILAFFSSHATGAIICGIFPAGSQSSGPSFSGTATVVTAAAGRGFSFDVAPLDASSCLLVYESTATNIKWGTVDAAGVFTSKQDTATANPSRMSITLTTGGNVAMCWAEGADFTHGNLSYIVSTTAGVVVTAPTSLDSGGNVAGYPVAGPDGTGANSFAFAWMRNDYTCAFYNGPNGQLRRKSFLVPVSKPFTGPNSAPLIWVVNHANAGDTAGLATYKLLEFGTMATYADVACEAVSCQLTAMPGAYYTSPTVMQPLFDSRRNGASLLSNILAPSPTAFGALLPIVSGTAYGTDVIRCDNSTWADRLLPARINQELIFSGSRLRGFGGGSLNEVGLGSGPEVLTLADAGAGTVDAGSHSYVVTYEAIDVLGRKLRSPPSNPQSITLASARNVTVSASGINCTGNIDTSNTRTAWRVWRTTAGGTVYYLLNTANASTAGDTGTGALAVLTDSTTDAALIANEILYTQGARGGLSGLLPNDEPPPCRYVWAGNNRLLMGGLEEASSVQWSKLIFPGEPLQFSADPAFRSKVDGEVTAVACLDGTWYVGTASSIWAFQGDGPDDTGGGGTFGDPHRLPADIGILSQRSIVEVQEGLLFQGRSDRIYLLPRGGNSPQWIAQAVRDTLLSFPFVASATLLPDENIVVFACLAADGSDGRLLIYDTRTKEWSVDSPFNGAAASTRAFRVVDVYGGKLMIDGRIAESAAYTDDETGSQTRVIVMTLVTGDIRPFGLLGRGRVRKAIIVGEYRSAATVTIEVSLDSGVTWSTPASFTPSASAGDTFKLEYDIPIVRGESFRFRIISTPTAVGEGLVFNGITLEAFQEKGTPRLADTARA